MAPTYTRDASYSALSTKDRHKLRKPAVEKMRRDRINSCIEQLKALLEKEFHQQDPNAKLEKADVLEMTVAFLRQQLQAQSAAPQRARSDGYSHCWRETLHFLSASSLKEVTLPRLQHLHTAVQKTSPPSSPQLRGQGLEKQAHSAQKPVWRPW